MLLSIYQVFLGFQGMFYQNVYDFPRVMFKKRVFPTFTGFPGFPGTATALQSKANSL